MKRQFIISVATVAIAQQLSAMLGIGRSADGWSVSWNEPLAGTCELVDVLPHHCCDNWHDDYAHLVAQCQTEKVGKYTWSYVVDGDDAVIVKAEVADDGPAKGRGILTTAISPKPSGTLTIPSKLGGKPVSRIAVFALKGCDGISTVRIPHTVTQIAPGTFTDCIKLKKIEVDKKNGCYSVMNGVLVNDIKARELKDYMKFRQEEEKNRCRGCPETAEDKKEKALLIKALRDEPPDYKLCEVPRGLQRVDLPKGVKYIMPKAFAGCKSLKKVSLPEGVQAIGYQAFAGCDNLEEIRIPKSVEAFCWAAFNYMRPPRSGSWSTHLLDANLPINQQIELSKGVFNGCPKLKTIKIANGNTSCSIENGCLIANNGKVLVKCMVDGEVEIPRSVMFICKGAFSGCAVSAFKVDPGHEKFRAENGLLLSGDNRHYWLEKAPNGQQKLTLPNNISIKGSAFDDCGVLEELTIPASAKGIVGAATGCSALKRVIFEGACKIKEYDMSKTRENGEHEAFSGFGENCMVFVPRNSKGCAEKLKWGEVPGTWHGSRMEFIPQEGEPWPGIAPAKD